MGLGLSWLDVGLAVGFYFFTLLGVTVGYHRYFTHGSFKAERPLRLGAGGRRRRMAIQGPVVQWVADHRRHHAFSDREGDPHSPWRYGTDAARPARRACSTPTWAGCSTAARPTPSATPPTCSRTRGLVVTSRMFVVWAFLSLALPGVIGGLVTGSWAGAWSAFFWAGLVRVALLHHVTWSINSVCHVVGNRPFMSRGRDRATNFWPLAILSAGESWHNLHHADPTCARHGVLRGQIDMSARVIWVFEKLGWARSVKWPDPVRLAAKRRDAARHRVRRRSTPGRPARAGRPGVAPAVAQCTDGRMRRRDQQPRPRVRMTGAQRRQQLLDVGRELFGQKGYEATSIEEVAARADVSKPVVYEHFGGKEGLYAVVVDREMQLAARPVHLGAVRPRPPPRAAGAGRAGAARLHRGGHRRLPGAHPGRARSPAASGTFSSLIGEVARKVEHILGRPVRRARLRPPARRALQPGAGRHGGAGRPVVAGQPLAGQARGRRAPGEPGLQRAGPPRPAPRPGRRPAPAG